MPSRAIVILLGAALAHTAAAQGTPPVSGDDIVEKWGRVKYCRAAYKHPDNITRVYEHDTESCAAAEAYVRQLTMSFNEASRANMERAADQRARVIMSGTNDIGWVLQTCRETCGAIAAEGSEGGPQ